MRRACVCAWLGVWVRPGVRAPCAARSAVSDRGDTAQWATTSVRSSSSNDLLSSQIATSRRRGRSDCFPRAVPASLATCRRGHCGWRATTSRRASCARRRRPASAASVVSGLPSAPGRRGARAPPRAAAAWRAACPGPPPTPTRPRVRSGASRSSQARWRGGQSTRKAQSGASPKSWVSKVALFPTALQAEGQPFELRFWH